MGKIFVGQTKLEISVYVDQQLNTDDIASIKYKKPDGTEGSFPATVVLPPDPKGHIKYDVQSANDIDQSGKWIFWAYITEVGGDVIAGECSKLTVHEEGNC